MSIDIPFEETEEWVELLLKERNSLPHESKIEADECSQNQHTNADICENSVQIMPLSKEQYDKTKASLTMFLTKVRGVIQQYRVKALTIVRAKCLTRRSARTYRSKSAAKSTASNSKNTDDGDPEPASPPVVFLRVKVESVFSFDTAFANRLAQGDA
ncbi:hypothetical protein Q1B72_001412 [Salmonella enterica]|nr:hypothetical protein [Salmonella enterica subsp. diarizonae]EAN8504744.1 hypothetical protein [Salmonella enterica]EKN5799839.1 hypothetical protein [Salmonella enterica subsp. enterica]EDL7785186.1 hypothetical protein [Salmonella enterica]EDV3839280.1 hypothetical protein [Salmonella enterica subsp. diarizonae]